eukprot:scaffold9106_cov50-Phaeocystis_antarctica.AAC.3
MAGVDEQDGQKTLQEACGHRERGVGPTRAATTARGGKSQIDRHYQSRKMKATPRPGFNLSDNTTARHQTPPAPSPDSWTPRPHPRGAAARCRCRCRCATRQTDRQTEETET